MREIQVLHKDGSSVPVEVHASNLFDAGGDLIGVQGTARDISERLENRQRLEASERRFRMLFEKTSEGVAVADIDEGRFLYVNPALAEMLGYTEDEFSQLKVRNIHPEESLIHVQAAFEQFAQRKSFMTPDIPCVRKNGDVVYADVNGTGMKIDGKLRAVGFLEMSRNYAQLNASKRLCFIESKACVELTR